MSTKNEKLKCRSKYIRNDRPICLLVEDGYYTDKPKDYYYFKNFLVNKYKFNPDNDENIRKLYNEVYSPCMKGYKYFENRNLPSFFSIFGLPSYRSELKYEYWKIRGYDTEWFSNFIKKRQSITTKESFIKRYGDIEGPKKFKEYGTLHGNACSKTNKSVHLSGKGYPYSKTINPDTGNFYTKEESILLSRENSKKGIIAAKKARDINKPFSIFQLSFWKEKGFSESEAREKIYSYSARNGLQYFVEKYGPEEGAKRYEARIKKYKETCSNKTDEEKLEWNIKRSKISHTVSKASTLFFDECLLRLQKEGIHINAEYGNKEHFLYDDINKSVYFYDFFSKCDNLIIEYNGIKFHPKYWKMTDDELKSWKSLYYNIPGDVQAKKDKRKQELAENCGYKFITIWEDDPVEDSIYKVIKTIKDIRNA